MRFPLLSHVPSRKRRESWTLSLMANKRWSLYRFSISQPEMLSNSRFRLHYLACLSRHPLPKPCLWLYAGPSACTLHNHLLNQQTKRSSTCSKGLELALNWIFQWFSVLSSFWSRQFLSEKGELVNISSQAPVMLSWVPETTLPSSSVNKVWIGLDHRLDHGSDHRSSHKTKQIFKEKKIPKNQIIYKKIINKK